MSNITNNAIPHGNGGGAHIFHHPFQDIHNVILNYMWSIAINIGIFLALYRYRRYTMVGHFIIGFVVGCSTLITSMPLVLDIPISTIPEDKRANFLIGIAIIAAVFVVIAIGALSKLLNFCETPSLVILWIGRVHKLLGYGLTILCKYQVYLLVKQSDSLYWIIMGQDILFILLLIIRKIYFPSL